MGKKLRPDTKDALISKGHGYAKIPKGNQKVGKSTKPMKPDTKDALISKGHGYAKLPKKPKPDTKDNLPSRKSAYHSVMNELKQTRLK